MANSTTLVTHCAPNVQEFAALRSSAGWNNPALPTLQQSLDSTLFWVLAYSQAQLVGCGRVIGDGAMYFYIQDVIVLPEFQQLKIGTSLMNAINAFIQEHCPQGSTVGLLAAQGKESFYEKFGFTARDGNALGLGMCKFL